MTYNPEKGAGDTFGHPVTYMALDIAALQELYGANTTYAAGDSTYMLTEKGTAALSLDEGDMSIGQAWACVWDTGGDDTISFAGNRASVINLNAATLDKTIDLDLDALRGTDAIAALTKAQRADIFNDWHTAGGSFSYVKGQIGGYSIANGVTVENAIGGNRRDLLIGNDAANELTGGAGQDTLFGHGGADVLTGGAGADTFIYSEGATIADFNAAEGDVMIGDWPVG